MFMEKYDFTIRKSEIEDLVAANDLNLATKRLMDLTIDFLPESKHKRETINIRSVYNELREESRMYGRTDHVDVRTKALRSEILDFVDELTEKRSLEYNSAEKSSSQRPEVIEQGDQIVDIPNTYRTQFEMEKEKFIKTRHNDAKTDVVVEARDITKFFKSGMNNFTLHPIDLQIRSNEIILIIGENGSGKTTLLRILAGIISPDHGSLKYPMLEVGVQHKRLVKRQMAYVPQTLQKWECRMGDYLHLTASIYGIKGDKNEEEVDFILNRLDLDQYRYSFWDEVSGGYRMRFTLANALLTQPRLLVLDEPLANLDINSQDLFLQDLRHLSSSSTRPLAVIISSQHIYKTENIADRIIFLKDGKAVYNGSKSSFGDDRTENVFEFSCDMSKLLIEKALESIARDIVKEGDVYIIHTALNVAASTVLNTLTSHNVNVGYFRDISRSARRVFLDE